VQEAEPKGEGRVYNIVILDGTWRQGIPISDTP
jgi:hypothetical protein